MKWYLRYLPEKMIRAHYAARLREIRRRRDRSKQVRDETMEEFRSLQYKNVGVSVVAWSEIEKNLDAIIDMGHFAYGEKNVSPILPDGLDRELDYVKKLAKGWSLIAPLSERLLAICAEVHNQKQYRHDLIHGSIDFSDPEQFVATLSIVKGATRTSRRTNYPPDKVMKIAKRLTALLRDIKTITIEVAELFVDEYRASYPDILGE